MNTTCSYEKSIHVHSYACPISCFLWSAGSGQNACLQRDLGSGFSADCCGTRGGRENFAVRFVPYSQCNPSEFDDPTGMWTLDQLKASFQSFHLSELQGLNGDADAENVCFNFLCLDTNEVEGYEFWYASAYTGDVNSADCLLPNSFGNNISYEFYRPLDSNVIYYVRSTQ